MQDYQKERNLKPARKIWKEIGCSIIQAPVKIAKLDAKLNLYLFIFKNRNRCKLNERGKYFKTLDFSCIKEYFWEEC